MTPKPASSRVRAGLKYAGATVAVLVVAVVLFLALFDWNRLRGPLARMASERTGYDVRIDGDLRVHALSTRPRASVEGVSVTNPGWRDRGRLLALDDATVEVRLWPLLIGRVIVERLTLTRPQLDLFMTEDGRANWQTDRRPVANRRPGQAPDLPLVRRFVIADGRLRIDDLKHRLSVHGTIAAAESAQDRSVRPFRVVADGTLNREPFHLGLEGGPLVNLRPGDPYAFYLTVSAGPTQVEAHGRVPEPFNLAKLDVDAKLSGRDLADLYFLSGVALPNSRPYALVTRVERRGTRIEVPRIDGRVGSSDLSGRAAVELATGRPAVTASLASHKLDLGDLAAPFGVGIGDSAADRGASPGRKAETAKASKGKGGLAGADGRLLPDQKLQVERIRNLEAKVEYRADAVDARRVPFRDVAVGLTLHAGVLTLDPVAFRFDPGRLAGTIRIDARGAKPSTAVDLRLADLELGKVHFRKAARPPGTPPPLEGVLRGRIRLDGQGASVREFAADADGGITLIVPHGEINQAIAELTGIDVARGLGIYLKDKNEQTGLRCGVADFKVRDGTVAAQSVVFDTDSVLITGRGKVDLAHEALDLKLQGSPKKFTLMRLRTPIEINGTLASPAFGVDAGKLATQGGAAVALGALLTPLASVLAFVDPGLQHDANCSALLADARGHAQRPTRTAAAPGRPPGG